MAVKLSLVLALCLLAASVSARAVRDVAVEPSTEAPAPAPTDAPAPASTEEPAPAPSDAPAPAPSDAPAPSPDAPAAATTAETPADEPATTAGTWAPWSKPTEIPNVIPLTCDQRPVKNDWLMIPDPTECERYITCIDNRAISQPCPTGLWFNYAQQICDWPWNVKATTCPQEEK